MATFYFLTGSQIAGRHSALAVPQKKRRDTELTPSNKDTESDDQSSSGRPTISSQNPVDTVVVEKSISPANSPENRRRPQKTQ